MEQEITQTPTIDASRLANPMTRTVLFLMVGAAIGGIIGMVVEFFAFLFGMTATPLAIIFLTMLPLAFAIMAIQLLWVFLGLPVWTYVGGKFFANRVGGQSGKAAKDLKITFLPEGHPIYDKVQAMAQSMGLPPVRHVGHFEDHSINAFACGQSRDNAMIAFTRGCIEKTTGDQFEAILAHELGHIASNDMQRMTYAYGVRDALTFFLVFRKLKMLALKLFTFVSEMEIMRFSRQREFYADAIGASLTSPQAMIGALEAIKADDGKPRHALAAYENLMFNGLLRSHPPLDKRIEAIRNATYIKQLPHK
ncbi:MAG: hypothetical protein CMH13_00175 [Martelella sp.]|uniref:M48 family metalloprotease n=1 Tax=unclassified Martelella TaxID=2629616 RepID=UPI000C5CED51|nr:M48 family metalloprotease [Martelella sp.]MAU18938.1 hypothetical protein [Martelella sp.]|tara:strand:- start:440 stop:1363 length:924 start_codon:yes stop_codon:yes gene_type:complete